jgi:hypothetical protein
VLHNLTGSAQLNLDLDAPVLDELGPRRVPPGSLGEVAVEGAEAPDPLAWVGGHGVAEHLGMSFWTTLTSLFAADTGEIDYCAYSITGSDFNPNAVASPPSVPVPTNPLPVMAPPNAQAFTGSCLKIGNGRNNETFTYPPTNPIGQGQKGVVDLCNAVTNVTVNATFGTGGSQGERLSSIKGCSGIKLVGARNGNGTWATHVLGRFYAEGRTVDTNIDYSGLPGGGTVVIARGLFPYLLGNKNKINLGSCKLALFKSLIECWFVHVKSLITKTTPVQTTAPVQPPPATP